MDLKDKVFIVTGGSSGIGYETSKMLVKKGAKVLITGRNESALQVAAAKINASYLAMDVSEEEDCKKMVSKVLELFGDLHGVINNAGFGYFANLVDTDIKKMREVYDTNVFGATMVAKEATKYFIDKNYGNILNVCSTAGRNGFAMGTAYSSSKFALSGLTECWRAELRKFNIRVMQINPSEVQTQFLPNSGLEARSYNDTKLQSMDIAHTIVSMLELEDRGFITEATVFATNPQG